MNLFLAYVKIKVEITGAVSTMITNVYAYRCMYIRQSPGSLNPELHVSTFILQLNSHNCLGSVHKSLRPVLSVPDSIDASKVSGPMTD